MASWRYKKKGCGCNHPHYEWTTTKDEREVEIIKKQSSFVIEKIVEAKPPKDAIVNNSKKSKKVSK